MRVQSRKYGKSSKRKGQSKSNGKTAMEQVGWQRLADTLSRHPDGRTQFVGLLSVCESSLTVKDLHGEKERK